MSKHVPSSSTPELKAFIEELFQTHYEVFQLYAYKLGQRYGYSLTVAEDMVMDAFFKVLNGNLKIDISSKDKVISIFKMKIKNNFIDLSRKKRASIIVMPTLSSGIILVK